MLHDPKAFNRSSNACIDWPEKLQAKEDIDLFEDVLAALDERDAKKAPAPTGKNTDVRRLLSTLL